LFICFIKYESKPVVFSQKPLTENIYILTLYLLAYFRCVSW